jgi:hypothetical protein
MSLGSSCPSLGLLQCRSCTTEEYTVGWSDVTNHFSNNNISGARAGSFLATKERWSALSDDPRVRISINTFLTHFMSKFVDEFAFEDRHIFGETNPPLKRRINFMKMTNETIEALSDRELREALTEQGVDVSQYATKDAMVSKALSV